MIEAYIICWNEIDTIQLTIDHYKTWCDKITFYDNYSDDGTPQVILKSGCQLVPFGTRGKLEDEQYRQIKNTCWKGSSADWVVICDCDEIIWHPNIKAILLDELHAGNTVFKSVGWDIFSNEMPNNSFLEITNGIASENYSKLAVFSPKIKSINYIWGCHVADPVGNVRYCNEKLILFHYRNIGGPQRLVDRHAIYRPRMSQKNLNFGLGIHYTYDDERRKKDWNELYNRARNFDIDRDFKPVVSL